MTGWRNTDTKEQRQPKPLHSYQLSVFQNYLWICTCKLDTCRNVLSTSWSALSFNAFRSCPFLKLLPHIHVPNSFIPVLVVFQHFWRQDLCLALFQFLECSEVGNLHVVSDILSFFSRDDKPKTIAADSLKFSTGYDFSTEFPMSMYRLPFKPTVHYLYIKN